MIVIKSRDMCVSFFDYQHNLSNLDFILTIYSKDVLCLNNHNLNTALKQLWHSCGDLYPR